MISYLIGLPSVPWRPIYATSNDFSGELSASEDSSRALKVVWGRLFLGSVVSMKMGAVYDLE